MSRLTRAEFTERLENKRIAIADAEGELRTALQRADVDRSGDVEGTSEAQRLFTEIDRFDYDGSYGSIRSRDAAGAPTRAGALADEAVARAKPNLRRGLSQAEFMAGLAGKQVRVDTLPEDVAAQVAAADVNSDGRIAGRTERAEAFRQLDRLDSDGNSSTVLAVDREGAETPAGRAARALNEAAEEDPSEPRLDSSVVSWTPNEAAMATARNSSLGEALVEQVPRHASTYRQASELTGVPPQLLAAVHGNESQFGTFRASTHGPESGYGLDDRFVSTAWGNQQLARYGLGTSQRGQDTETGRLQSAVIAGEHLKRVAGYAGIEVGPGMSQAQLAGAATAYTTGVRAAKRAEDRGRSWMFDVNDANPHPRHPGGTSRTPSGTVTVAPSRKEGLLRWDTLVPLVEESMGVPAMPAPVPQS